MTAEPARGPVHAQERATILLVEDDPAVRRSLQLLLQARGYLVRSFSSGTNLLATPDVTQAAILVADYRLPEIDGIAVLKRLRGAGWQGGAVLITGYNDPDLPAQALAAGFADVIEKPLLESSLSGVITRLLQSGSPSSPSN